MGCDIHVHLETKPKDETKNYHVKGHWLNTGLDIHMPRNYYFFSLMWCESRGDGELFERRGMPKDACVTTNIKNWCFSDDSPIHDWVKAGYSEYVDEEKTRVTNPDWHNHSWLTLDELKQCCKAHLDKWWRNVEHVDNYLLKWKALIAFMEIYEAADQYTRIVFWFDN